MPPEYLQMFVDNGYDDFETVKQVGLDDLAAIGVTDEGHQGFILEAVRVLREKGAVWVYLLDTAVHQDDYDSTAEQQNVIHVTPERHLQPAAAASSGDNRQSVPVAPTTAELKRQEALFLHFRQLLLQYC